MAVCFQSRGARLRVVLVPERNIYGREGKIGTEPGTTVQFNNSVFWVNDANAKKLGMSPSELTQKLREAGTFNLEFWELGNAPGEPKPTVEDMLERITDAATRQNVDRLRELKHLEEEGDGERGGHKRSEILAAIDRPLAILTDGKEGKLGPGRPHKPKPHEAEARKEMTRPAA